MNTKKKLCFILMIIGTILLIGCSKKEAETVYTVDKRDFYYSFDNGATYGAERVELEVGKTILMKVIILITTNKDSKEEIKGTLLIPKITALDAYYIRGQKITGKPDPLNNAMEYSFNISTNEEWIFIFEFVPISESRVQMVLDFESPIPEMYDGIYTIKFVNPANQSDDGKSD